MIITGIMLLAVTAFSQHSSRDRTRQQAQDRKSEVTAVRKVHNHKSKATIRPGIQNSSTHRESNARRPADRQNTQRKQAVNPARRKTVQTSGSRTVNTGNKSAGTRSAERKVTVNTRTDKGQARKTGPGNNRVRTSKPGNGQTHARKPGSLRAPESRPGNEGRGNYGNENRRNYTTPNRKHVRHSTGVPARHVPVRYKTIRHHYRTPSHVRVVWTPAMYREYRIIYPDFHYWYYPAGYTIVTIPAYNAYFHIGEVRNVYGRIHEVWYSWTTDEYYLYFGGTYPYQDFTVILSGRHARRFHRHPEAFFEGRYIWVTGLVSTFEGKPEILVKRSSQVHLY